MNKDSFDKPMFSLGPTIYLFPSPNPCLTHNCRWQFRITHSLIKSGKTCVCWVREAKKKQRLVEHGKTVENFLMVTTHIHLEASTESCEGKKNFSDGEKNSKKLI